MRTLTAAIAAAALLAQASAQDATPAAPPDSRATAREFLTRLETRHGDTRTLRGSFEQLRVDPVFLEEVRSEGTFAYEAPGKFRADYRGKNDKVSPSALYIVGDRMWNYVPELKTVDTTTLPKGDSAAINQILLGFGVKVEQVDRFFEVDLAEEEGAPGATTLVFRSKDPSRTLNYDRITIAFDPRTLLPSVLMLDSDEARTTMTLTSVDVNPTLEAGLFDPKFPGDVEIVERSRGGSAFDPGTGTP
ncbi:MAG: outer membrane lipoprotein carrier protein LolA [Candidatus Sumerlaeia bacterium]|nr:outer membrane lipoprotein carrier protein LolA [Candidatus Sumerlaeia bacterium]